MLDTAGRQLWAHGSVAHRTRGGAEAYARSQVTAQTADMACGSRLAALRYQPAGDYAEGEHTHAGIRGERGPVGPQGPAGPAGAASGSGFGSHHHGAHWHHCYTTPGLRTLGGHDVRCDASTTAQTHPRWAR